MALKAKDLKVKGLVLAIFVYQLMSKSNDQFNKLSIVWRKTERLTDWLWIDGLFDGVRDWLIHYGLLINWMTFDVFFKPKALLVACLTEKQMFNCLVNRLTSQLIDRLMTIHRGDWLSDFDWLIDKLIDRCWPMLSTFDRLHHADHRLRV